MRRKSEEENIISLQELQSYAPVQTDEKDKSLLESLFEKNSSLLESLFGKKESTLQKPKKEDKESSLPELGGVTIKDSPQNPEGGKEENDPQKPEETDEKDENAKDIASGGDDPEEGTSHSYYTRAAERKAREKEGGKAKTKTKNVHTIAPLR